MVKVNSNLYINGQNSVVNYPIGANGISNKDSFVKEKSSYHSQTAPYITSPTFVNFNYNYLLAAYSNKASVEDMIAKNPKVKQLLDTHNVALEISPENVMSISDKHLKTTKAFALQIANEMNLSRVDKQIIEQACTFHDFGKILIPKSILNKPGKLTPEEKTIMDLHAQLGYELLSTTDMNKRTLELIKNHHLPQSQNNDILGQILSVADIYSALREERPYKKAFTQFEAFKILDQKAQNGEVSAEVVDALKASYITGIAV